LGFRATLQRWWLQITKVTKVGCSLLHQTHPAQESKDQVLTPPQFNNHKLLDSTMSALITFLENHSQKCQTITLITN
jgi:hypothetical protein